MDGEKTSQNPLGEPVATRDGSLTMRHPDHGECYHSQLGARSEAEALYVDASGFRDALALGRPLTVWDVGLGLGYNALATIVAWHRAPTAGPLTLVSFEIMPLLVEALASGEAPWQTGWSDAERTAFSSLAQGGPELWQGTLVHPNGATGRWDVHVGDARKAKLGTTTSVMPSAAGASGICRADFIWQDPFSPAKNPTMWDAAWFALVREHAASDALLVTYSVARTVRDALSTAGWQWEKIKAATELKKHWLRARPLAN